MPETHALAHGNAVDDHFFRRYRALLDAEDSRSTSSNTHTRTATALRSNPTSQPGGPRHRRETFLESERPHGLNARLVARF